MLSGVLKSDGAIVMNIQIIRIFTKMREFLSTHKDVLLKIEQSERTVSKNDTDIKLIFEYLKELLSPKASPYQKDRI